MDHLPSFRNRCSMMKTRLLFVLLLLLLKRKVTYATNWPWPTQKYSELNVHLQGFTFKTSKVDDIFECYRKCEENILCASINMNLKDKTCELKYSTKTRHPQKTVSQQNMIYMEIRDDNAPLGSRPDIPITSCKKLKNDDSQAKSGVYWMKFNEPSSASFQVFCDMTTDGGGWTLVYSYTFTQYNIFDSLGNAVTPIPNWPVNWSPSKWVPQSTTTPLSESSRSAMDFNLWKNIGREFLIKPNITNWVACVEGTGSLVNWVEGSVACRVVQAITSTCTTVAPNTIRTSSSCGTNLRVNNKIYLFFDGKTDSCKPFHDPCGTKSFDNHLTNVPNPGGTIYIR